MLVVYELSRIGLTEKVLVDVLPENVIFSDTSASLFVPRVIIASDTDCIPPADCSAYTVSDCAFDRQCNVAGNHSTLCSGVFFSLSAEVKSSCFFSVREGQGEFFIADRKKLYQVSFTVPGTINLPRGKRENPAVRRSKERRVFLNQNVCLSKGVLRL